MAGSPKMVFAFQKVKSRSGVRALLAHNLRYDKPNNARTDRERHNVYPVSTKRDINKTMLAYQNNLNGHKPRKNAVWAHEYVISGSRDGFKGLGMNGSKAYFKDAVRFLQEMYGHESLIIPTIHFDERTPHLHVIVQPMKDGKLNGKAFTGGSKHAMAQLRTRFYKNVALKHGFERGEPKNRIKHKDLDEHYKLVETRLPVLREEKTRLELDILHGQSDIETYRNDIQNKKDELNSLEKNIQALENERLSINDELKMLNDLRNNTRNMAMSDLNEAIEMLNNLDRDRRASFRM
jgi:hypothetical protein